MQQQWLTYRKEIYEKQIDSLSYFNHNSIAVCFNDQIDRLLFENLYVGENITITYFEKSGGLRKICALEYNGETYLSLDDVLNEYDQNEKIAHIVGPTIVVLAISAGAILFIINCKKNRGK